MLNERQRPQNVYSERAHCGVAATHQIARGINGGFGKHTEAVQGFAGDYKSVANNQFEQGALPRQRHRNDLLPVFRQPCLGCFGQPIDVTADDQINDSGLPDRLPALADAVASGCVRDGEQIPP